MIWKRGGDRLMAAVLTSAILVSVPGVLEAQSRPKDNLYTRSADLYLNRAQTNPNQSEKQARFREALEAALKGIDHEPGNPKSYFQAGQAYSGLGDLGGADSMFTKAEELYPDYLQETSRRREQQWVQNYNMGIGRLQQGDMEAAIEFFDRANLIFDRRPEAMLNLASAHAQLGNIDGAVEAYDQAIALMTGPIFDDLEEDAKGAWTENTRIAAFNKAQLLAQEAGRLDDEAEKRARYNEAVEAYELYLGRDPGNVQALSNLALVLSQMEEGDSAMVIYEQLLTRDDLNSTDYFNTGIGLFQAQSYGLAAEAFARATDLVPNNRDNVYNLAQTLFLSEQYEELVPVAEQLVEEMDPWNYNAYNLLIQGLVQTGGEELALEYQHERDSLAFELGRTRVQPSSNGGGTLIGEITNNFLEEGTPITMTIIFVDPEGNDLGTTEVTVEAPAPESSTVFQTQFQAAAPASGWRYEVTSHSH